jgi:hypothetical protein
MRKAAESAVLSRFIRALYERVARKNGAAALVMRPGRMLARRMAPE